MEPQPKIIVIIGPTAAGKTSTGIKQAQNTNGIVISADSRQIYVGFNIGTAKPKAAWKEESHDILTPDKIENVPHYFLNTYSPTTQITLSKWQEDANTVISALIQQETPIYIVGGTMLYVDSLVFNFNIPQVPPNNSLRDTLEKESSETLYNKLIEQDPDASKFIEAHNKLRIIRALEVMAATNQPFSAQRKHGPNKYNFEVVGIFPGWDTLEKNITTRVNEMLDAGLLEEAKSLIEKYGADLPLLKTMNYKQAIRLLNKEYSKEEAIKEMIKVNIRYARRQMSWWKNRVDIKWLT